MNTITARPLVRSISQSPERSYVQDAEVAVESYLAQKGLLEGLTVSQKHSLEVALKNIFPDQKEETRIQRARQTMGDAVAGLSNQELEEYLTEFQFLVDSWVDEFEKIVFNNITLKQLLREV